MGKASKKESKKKMSKKERQEQAKEDFKESLDKHMPNSREAVEIATFGGLTTMYYFGAQPIYDKYLSLAFQTEDSVPIDEMFLEAVATYLETNWRITITENVLNSFFPGGFLPGWKFGDVKLAVANAIGESVPEGMTLDQTEQTVLKAIAEEQERLSRWLAMDDPPQTKEALDSVRAAIRRYKEYLFTVRRIQGKIRFIRLMGAMGAAGLSIYFAQDYNISQLIPGE